MDQCLQKLSQAWPAGEDILQGVRGLLATSFRGPEVAALQGSPDTISGHSGTLRWGAALLTGILSRGQRGQQHGGVKGQGPVLDDAILGQLMQLQVVEGLPWADDSDVCRTRGPVGPGGSHGPRSHHPLRALLSTPQW